MKILLVPLLVAAFPACGDDDAATSTAGPADETTMAEEMGDDGTAEPATGGTVTIGAETWTFVPDIQCSVWPDGTINIAGSAEMDSSLEIVFDRFDDGSMDLRVSGPDYEWVASGDDFGDVTVEGDNVSGVATMTQMIGGDTTQAAFDFRC